MLGTDGTVETARQGRDATSVEDRKIDLVVQELERYDIRVAALQETKWLGREMYHVGESVVLTAGRPVPAPEQPIQGGEGVAIVLRGPAISAWSAAGQRWKAWSSRLVSTCLLTGSRDILHIIILSCYAPTRRASCLEKDEFFQHLEHGFSTHTTQ